MTKTIKSVAYRTAVLVLLFLSLRTIPGVAFVSDILTPILFFGKVVDEKGNPIASANVDVSFADIPFSSGTKEKLETTSQGRFWTFGHGFGVAVSASKPGYYILPESRGTFSYSPDGGKPDRHMCSANPAIFVLRKMGETESLIVTKGDIIIPRDGTPRPMKLSTGKTWIVPDGDIVVQAWTHDREVPVNSNQHYDWRCKITVPNGGIQQNDGGRFSFIAPENGYQPSIEIDMPANSNPWSSTASRNYFVQLGNGTYARVDFVMYAGGDHFFSIVSYLNPQPGHRNLKAGTQ